eukprot:TRINITY_DN5267_c0_g1_i1.p1 TRINITY_DN5267_c0_g1~~TRINITY_DN5267_c0_g1_i1.p1  ORF type:complete len:276 (+),score=67.32 TRINITY_DN5267_c0_g1_i1:44-871(+)
MTVEISSGWSTTTGSLACSVVSSLESFSLDDLTPNSCVHLSWCSDDDRGELVLTATRSTAVSGFLLVTDCPRWEVVGGIQYLTSVQGDLLDSFEGTQVFSVQLKLPKTYEKLTLRLPPSVRSCWLYCVQAVTEKIESVKIGHFDLNNVNILLGEEKQLSNKAEKFKSLFENFQASQNNPGASDMLKSPPKMSDLMLNPMLLHSMMGKPHSPLKPRTPITENPDTDTNFLLLKTYIDKKFEIMEHNIMKVIEEKDKLQNVKLDKILEHLHSVKNDR